MPTTADRVFRDHNRYTGDGLPNEPVGAPLPVGDPQSGAFNPNKAELRSFGGSVETSATAAATAQAQAEAAAALALSYSADAVAQGNVPIYSTVAAIESFEVPVGITNFRTHGYADADDDGGWSVKEIDTPPAHTGYVADDSTPTRYFVFNGEFIDLAMVGAPTDGSDVYSALVAADDIAAALGIPIRVSRRSYTLETNYSVVAPVVFDGGDIDVAEGVELVLNGQGRTYLPDHVGGGDHDIDNAFRWRGAVKKLFTVSKGENILDLGGRVQTISSPLDLAALSGLTQHYSHTIICNGTIQLSNDFPASTSSTKTLTMTAGSKTATLTSGSSPEVGMRVVSAALPIETYVEAVVDSTITLTKQAKSSGSFSPSFRKINFAIDMLGFNTGRMGQIVFRDMEFRLRGKGSGIRLSPECFDIAVEGCRFSNPDYYCINAPIGKNSSGLRVSHSRFVSGEAAIAPTSRQTRAIAVATNDNHVMTSHFSYFETSMIFGGGGHLVVGNHFIQGYPADNTATRTAGLVITLGNGTLVLTGNYVDNCFIRWENEDDLSATLGSACVAGNRFTVNGDAPDFHWLDLRPRATDVAVKDLTVTGNHFYSHSSVKDVTGVSTGFGTIDKFSFNEVWFANNAFRNVNKCANPAVVTTNIAGVSTAVMDFAAIMPFGARLNMITAILPEVSAPASFAVTNINRSSSLATVTLSTNSTGRIRATGNCNFQSSF